MPEIVGAAAAQSTQSQQETQTERLDGNNLGQDAFFKLLITQLQNQDPLNPMEDREFISQMAEFSSLEKTEKLYSLLEDKLSSNQVIANSNLIGKEVKVNVEDVEYNGVVKSIKSQGDQIFAVLDTEEKVEVDINYITQVKEPDSSSESDPETDTDTEEKETNNV